MGVEVQQGIWRTHIILHLAVIYAYSDGIKLMIKEYSKYGSR
jgi:hypothetical protein